MIKISRKILPSFILTAVLAIAGGFSDGMVASAKTVAMNDGMNMQNQTMHSVEGDSILHESAPVGNALKPCCVDQEGGAPAIQAVVFGQDVKFSVIGFSDSISDNNSVFEHKLTELSSASPPKPDVLSSILKKE